MNQIKNILVTGGTGFVGKFIANSLTDQYSVVALGSKDLDLRDVEKVTQWFETNEIDAVVHCALSGREVLSSTDPTYLSDGLLMFRNLWLNRHRYQTLIHLGTAYEFDLTQDNTNIREGDFIYHLPRTSYGYAKNVAARIIRDTENFYNLRIFGNCHETESNNRFFQRVINQPEIVIGNDQYIDYLYMPDIIPMIKCILEGSAQDNDINMVYPNKYRLSELAYMLCDHLEIDKSKIKVTGSNGNNLTGDPSVLSKYKFNLIGIEEGLKRYKA